MASALISRLSSSVTPRVAGERIVLTIWVGVMWGVGFVVAPVLFPAINNTVLAGELAGRLFEVVNYIGLGAATLLLLSAGQVCGRGFLHRWQVWVLLAMAVLIVIAQFVLTPMMQAIHDAAHGVAIDKTAYYVRFTIVHDISATLYGINSLLGLALAAIGLPEA